MSSARGNRRGAARLWRPGLRGRLTLWTTAVLAASLLAGFVWVHLGLRAVLEARNDAFLASKAEELTSIGTGDGGDASGELRAEVRREVAAYEREGLVVVIARPGGGDVYPLNGTTAWLLAWLADEWGRLGPGPFTHEVHDSHGTLLGTFRVVKRGTAGRGGAIALGLSTAETEATLAQFDRRAAAGGLAFFALAVLGGVWLSRQALRPVSRSIATARRLNPADLSARLPRTGANDELDQLAGTINDLLDRLAAYHDQGARFTADASHELRGPLAAMRAAVEVALARPRTADEHREVLGSLGEQCDRLTALVNGLLLLARADAGQVDLRREPVDLAALASEVAEMYAPLAEERGLTLTWGGAAAAPSPAVGDPGRLRQLLTNLVDNAVKFTAPGGRVEVAATRADGRAVVSVSDTGVGIPADALPHVFDRFYQADPARSSRGSGLGLSISRWIAEAHAGSLRADSSPGLGSTFTLEIPSGGP